MQACLVWTPCSEELDRPENRGLRDMVKKLQAAKAAIDATSARASKAACPPCAAPHAGRNTCMWALKPIPTVL